MIELALSFLLSQQPNEHVDRFCALVVNVPYGTDNITDKEWEQIQQCRNFFNRKHHDHTPTTLTNLV